MTGAWELISQCRFVSLNRAWIDSATSGLWMYGLSWLRRWLTTDGFLLWQTPTYDGEDVNCIQQSLLLHCLRAILIMWLLSVTHALDDRFGGQDYDDACSCFFPNCDGALRVRACAICPCMNVIALVSARIRSGNFDWLSSRCPFAAAAACAGQEGVSRQTGLISPEDTCTVWAN